MSWPNQFSARGLLADHPHSHDPEPSGETPYKAVMVSTTAISTGTIVVGPPR